MLVRIKVKRVDVGGVGGWGQGGLAGCESLGYVQFLTAGLAGPIKKGGGGAQSSRSETLKHQRERHYPERTRKQKPGTQAK